MFNWDRDYNLKYDLTKSLKFDFTAKNRAFINEPYGKVDEGAFGYDADSSKTQMLNSIKSFGETMNYGHIANVTFKWPFNKFPLTDWITLTTRYSANYDWTRSPLALDNFEVVDENGDTQTRNVGNIIQNSRVVTWNGKLNMTTLYNKVPYFKKVNKKFSKISKGKNNRFNRSSKTNRPTKGKEEEKDKIRKTKKPKDMSLLELESELKRQKGRAVKDVEKIEELKKFIKKKKKEKDKLNVFDHTALLVMSLKNVSVNYSTNDGILLPGYNSSTNVMGMDNNFFGPSFDFIAGGNQMRDIFGDTTSNNFARDAYLNNWLVDTANFDIINTQFAANHTEKLNIKATLKPILGLRIDLSADRNLAENTNSNLGWDDFTNEFDLRNEQFTGSFSTSIITWRTAFNRDLQSYTGDALQNATFDNLRNFRQEVSAVLGENNPNSLNELNENGYTGGYGSAQQEVIIGSFLAAYAGKNVNKRTINPFKQIPLPNWRITYDGLSKIKWVKKYVKTLSFSHSYRSSFNLSGYTTNLDGKFDSDGNATAVDIAGNFIGQKQILTMSIMEQFAPLLGVDITLKNSVMAKLEIKKDRNISLSLANNQITEIKGAELVIGSGYTWKKLQLPIKFNGKKVKASDLVLRLDISIRDNKTITRKIIENQNQATAGQKMTSIKFSGNYKLGKSLTVRLYYDRVMNTPFISTSFPTANTNAGVALRFMLQ